MISMWILSFYWSNYTYAHRLLGLYWLRNVTSFWWINSFIIETFISCGVVFSFSESSASSLEICRDVLPLVLQRSSRFPWTCSPLVLQQFTLRGQSSHPWVEGVSRSWCSSSMWGVAGRGQGQAGVPPPFSGDSWPTQSSRLQTHPRLPVLVLHCRAASPLWQVACLGFCTCGSHLLQFFKGILLCVLRL